MSTHKIVHLTSAHARYDTRIFIKMCSSLANNGYDVSLIVADNKGDKYKNKVNIFDIGQLKGRINRIFKTTQNIYQKALELNCDLYHIHDPELIPIGLKLKKKGKKVIFDAHEDLPKQLLGKSYLKPYQRKLLSWFASQYEQWSCKKLDAIVAATPYIRDKFLTINPMTVDINNFPILEELAQPIHSWTYKKNYICYVGGISRIRGINEIVHSMSLINSPSCLILAGSFEDQTLSQTIQNTDGWHHVEYVGWADRIKVSEIYCKSKAGLVTLHPLINYLDALPVKMFEYMAAGIPVIASNFPLWREIIEGNQCGICVDPLNPNEIAHAIDYLMNHPQEAKQMGHNGLVAVTEKYNWHIEEKKLFQLYAKLLK